MLKRNTLSFKIVLSFIAVAFVIFSSISPIHASINGGATLEGEINDMVTNYESSTKDVTDKIKSKYIDKSQKLINKGKVIRHTSENIGIDYSNAGVKEVNENYYMVELRYNSNTEYHQFSGLSLTFEKKTGKLIDTLEVQMKEVDDFSGTVKAWQNGKLMIDEVVKQEVQNEKEVSTFGFWSDFNDCLSNQGVAAWAIQSLSLVCAGVCIGTAGTGCVACLYGASFVTGGTIGTCLGSSI